MLELIMLTINQPNVARALAEYPGGLFPGNLLGGDADLLVIKCPKEMILTAKAMRQLKFYLLPLDADGVRTTGLVTAFFDDEDEPLVIRSPLLNDEMASSVLRLLALPTFDIHFFDEYNRELLGYRSRNETVADFASKRDQIHLAPSSHILSSRVDDQLMLRFAMRGPEDDRKACVVHLAEELFPSDFVVWDSRPENNAYQGRRHDMITSLERENAGLFSELDVVKSLTRVFPSKQIFLNPLRTDNGREFVDVMVATDAHLLLIQAKDSPNTIEVLSRPIARKISTVERHLEKAISQLRGSISHLNSEGPLVVRCGSTKHEIATDDLEIWCLVLVKEMFSTEYDLYSRNAFKLLEDTGYPCVVQDYQQLNELTHHRRDENSFFDTLDEVMEAALRHGKVPRLRFWL